MNDDPAKQAWQASVEIGGALPLDEVRKGARKFYRYVWWRNAVEYVACVIVVISFGWYVFWLPHPLQKIGSALIVIATFYVGWQLHRRASAVPLDSAGTMPIMAFARVQMVRQRDALRSIFWWYLLPFFPGLVLLVFGSIQFKGGPQPIDAAGTAGMTALFAFVWWINRYSARRLQRHIDEIDALMGASE
jgi:hypothetical protein